MRIVSILIVVTLVALGSVASAEELSEAEIQKRVETVLNNYEVVPERAELEAFIPDAQTRLIEAAKDEAGILWTRQRAISLLSLYPDARSMQVVMELTKSEHDEVRRMAYYTLGRGFGTVDTRRAVEMLEQGLKDSNPKVREFAVRGLRYIATDNAQRILEKVAEGGDESLAKVAEHALKKRSIN